MGRSSSFCCKTCKVNISLGYGCYSTWLDNDAKTVAEYDALEDDNKHLPKNKAFRQALVEHEEHDWFLWSEDWYSTYRGKLTADWSGEVLVDDFEDYERVLAEDLWDLTK